MTNFLKTKKNLEKRKNSMWYKEKCLFVTGTDTNVGKTFVSLKILEDLKKSSLQPGYFKPIATGGIISNGALMSEDALLVKKTLKLNQSIESMNPIILSHPNAPSVSAALEGIDIDLNLIRSQFSLLMQQHSSLVVEGIGGIMVPIKNDFLVLDLIQELNLPTLVVSKPYLGTINHTLLTLEVLKTKKIALVGIVMCCSQPIPLTPAEIEAIAVIEKLSGIPIIKSFKFEKKND